MKALFLVDTDFYGNYTILHNWIDTINAVKNNNDFVSTCLSAIQDVWGNYEINNNKIYIMKNKKIIEFKPHMDNVLRDLRTGNNLEKLIKSGYFDYLFEE